MCFQAIDTCLIHEVLLWLDLKALIASIQFRGVKDDLWVSDLLRHVPDFVFDLLHGRNVLLDPLQMVQARLKHTLDRADHFHNLIKIESCSYILYQINFEEINLKA